MINKELARFLLDESSVNEPVAMVHGTSVEAVRIMFNSGKLPSSLYMGESNHTSHQGWLYFRPRKKSFEGHPLHKDITIDLDGPRLMHSILYYAEFAERNMYLKRILGHKSDIHFEDLQSSSFSEDDKDIIKIRKVGLRNVIKDLEKLSGVCIGIKPSILRDFEIKNGQDIPGTEVMVYLPKGLDIKYVQYVSPFGDIEENALKDLVSKLSE